MNQSFYTAAVGAGQQQQRMNVLGNNIANLNTYGYKAEKPSFASLMNNNILGIEQEQLPRGTGLCMMGTDIDFNDGALVETGRKLDHAILGNGFFSLYDASTGEISYTRDGSFTLSSHQQTDEQGVTTTVNYLSDGAGRFVLNRRGGLLTVTDQNAALPIGVYEFTNQNGMVPVGGGRFLPIEKNGQVQMGEAQVQQGMLEASNTDLANELTKVIEAQRSYSYALKMVQTSDEIENTINGLRG